MKMLFTFKMGGKALLMLLLLSAAGMTFAQQSLPYSYGIETLFSSSGWTKVGGNATGATNGNAIHVGNYGFQFGVSSSSPYNGAQYLISPELDGTDGIWATFWYRNYNANSKGYFNWGYTDQEIDFNNFDATAFTWVNGNNPNTPSDYVWHQAETFACPAGTKYVAVSCEVVPNGNYTSGYAFVDDFSFIKPTVKTLDYTYGFETALENEGWTTYNGYVSNKAWQTKIATGEAKHEGLYGFQFAFASTSSPQYLISPELTGVPANGVAVDFYYQVYSTTGQTFQVGYSTTTNATTAFTFGETFTADNKATSQGGTGWAQSDQQVFPASTKYVAIKFTGSSYFFVDDITITEAPAINAPTDLTITPVSTTSATLTWNGENGYTYNVEYKAASDAEWTSHATGLSATTTQIPGLTAGTSYQVRVQSAFKGQTSGWTSTSFITECEAFALPYEYGFEDASEMNCWTLANSHTGTGIAGNNAVHDGGSKGFQFQAASNTGTQYLISPELTGVADGVAVSFWYKNFYDYFHATFKMGYSNTTNEVEDFIWDDDHAITVTTGNSAGWKQFVSETFCNYDAKYVAIQCSFTYYNSTDPTTQWPQNYSAYAFVDDISLYERPSCLMPTNLQVTNITPASATVSWNHMASSYDINVNGTVTVGVTSNSYTLENLEPNTAYTVKVRSNCGSDNYSNWTAAESFTTLNKAFITKGDWNVASNWLPAVVPTVNEKVDIMAPATIAANTIGYANTITIKDGGSITIKDGGQLKHSTYGLQVTVEKEINKWTVEQTQGENLVNGWYLIANPLNSSISPSNVTNMLSTGYDLYLFNAAASDGLEWRNYKAGAFNLVAGNGYLYANSQDVTLKFTGNVYATNFAAPVEVDYTYSESGTKWNGWMLKGNLYVCDGYLRLENEEGEALSSDFYVMNAAGNDYELSSSSVALAPLQAAFIHSTQSGKLKYYSHNPNISQSPSPMLEMTVSQDRSNVDKARVRFGNGHQLPKLSFNDNSSKLYIPQNGTDYAVVRSNGEGELPINFKAEKNGTYTLNFDMENVEFDNLLLIDNLTGVETDLLATPNYTFTAKTTDYASRFRLMFSANNVNENAENDTFAYFNGSEWVINGSDNASFQVIDMMGRVVFSGTNTIATNNMQAGVYVIRLVDGNNVKTQKIVVR